MNTSLIQGHRIHIDDTEAEDPAAAQALRDDLADHGDFSLWPGRVLPIDFDALRAFMELRRKREAPGDAKAAAD